MDWGSVFCPPPNIHEIELFKAVNLWATKRCEEQSLSTDGSEKRRILGERIVEGIRFSVMAEVEFASVVLDCKILTQDEAFNLFKYFNSVPGIPVGFPETDRTGLKELFEPVVADLILWFTLVQVILIHLINKTVFISRSTETSPCLE